MKIIFEVPDETVAMVVTGICENRSSYTMSTTRVETSECKDGAEIVCNWKGVKLMRLIDADALMKKIREVDFVADVDLMKITHDSMLTGFFHGSVQGIVDRLPTAYDPDKIVEQLEELATQSKELCERATRDGSGIMARIWAVQQAAFEQAIEIVKSGGKV